MNKDYKEYTKGFKDGYNAALNKSSHPNQIIFYGYTLEQILYMIEKEEMNKLVEKFKINKLEEPKLMTRKEAIEIFFKTTYPESVNDSSSIHDFNLEWSKKAIAALEALGLIKFKEEKKVERTPDMLEAIKECRLLCYGGSDHFLNELEKRGYTVTKNG